MEHYHSSCPKEMAKMDMAVRKVPSNVRSNRKIKERRAKCVHLLSVQSLIRENKKRVNQ